MSNTGEPDPTPGFSGGSDGRQDTPVDTDGATGDSGTGAVAHPDRFLWAPYVVGFAVLVGYAILLAEMMRRVKTGDVYWGRYMYLFSGVEALAFAAAGFFFGREVNRGRAEAAESRAKVEANRAMTAEKKAANATAQGAALSEGVRSMFEGSGTSRHLTSASTFRADPTAPADTPVQQLTIPVQHIRGLVTLADRWFPRR